MFDIGWTELLVIAAVALVVVGPRELPGMLRSIGRMMAGVRRMASDFQSQFNEAIREAELDELRKEVDGLRRTASGFLDGGSDPLSTARDTLKSAIEGKPGEAKPAEDLSAATYDPTLLAPIEEPSIMPPSAAEASLPAPSADGVEALRAFPPTEPAPTADGMEALRAFPPIEPPPQPDPAPPAEYAPAPAADPAPANGAARP
jgi:sec-independent protein translocase protein TatB